MRQRFRAQHSGLLLRGTSDPKQHIDKNFMSNNAKNIRGIDTFRRGLLMTYAAAGLLAWS
jgi:hypothetical protein